VKVPLGAFSELVRRIVADVTQIEPEAGAYDASKFRNPGPSPGHPLSEACWCLYPADHPTGVQLARGSARDGGFARCGLAGRLIPHTCRFGRAPFDTAKEEPP